MVKPFFPLGLIGRNFFPRAVSPIGKKLRFEIACFLSIILKSLKAPRSSVALRASWGPGKARLRYPRLGEGLKCWVRVGWGWVVCGSGWVTAGSRGRVRER